MTKSSILPNEKQLECINNIEGKYLVLAGPGTGKTFTVIQRIKNMLQKGILPEKILCLTFTDAAANEMKTRINSELDKLDSGINIYTYHGLCFEIIENNPEDFELPENIKIITEATSRAFIKECIDELNPKAFRTDRNDPYFYINTIKNRIEEIKKNRLTKEQYFYNLEHNKDWKPKLQELISKNNQQLEKGKSLSAYAVGKVKDQEKTIAKAEELWDFYELYQEKMQKNHYLDFNDMISLVLDKFENNPAFLEKIANKYDYILVDEYQDTNKSQNSIVFNLTHALKTENIFVVGDDDQIIYSFQGAKLDTIEKFLEEFPETKAICLTENMRSTQNILDAAYELAKQDTKRIETNAKFSQYKITKNLTSKNENLNNKNSKVRCYKYVDIMQEYNEIVKEIEQIINSDSCPKDKNGNKKLSEIAILTRSNAELETFAEMFKAKNIPYELKEGKNIFTIKSSMVLYYYMQMLTNPELHSDKIFKVLLSPPFNINPKDYMTLYERRSMEKSFIESIKALPLNSFLEPEKIKNFVEIFDHLTTFKANENLKTTILEIGAKTGIFDYYLNSEINRCENIAGLKKLVDEAIGYSDVNKSIGLEDFVEYLNIALNDDIEIKTDKAPVTTNAVQLSTYYSAKGKEYEYVYMPTLLSHKWESDNKSLAPSIPVNLEDYKNEKELKEDKLSDRIKVMYVGMTRAKHTLRLSYVQTINGSEKKPSKLILNLLDMFEKEKEPFEYDLNSFWNEMAQTIVKCDYDYKKDFQQLIDTKLENKTFSPTAINVYRKCPRQYLYHNILNFASPYKDADALHYGSSVHEACEFAVKYAIENQKYPQKDDFINAFITKLNNLPLSSIEQRNILQTRGEKALSEYYSQLCNTPISNLHQTEMELLFADEDITFKGFIDRIDKNDDGTYTICDYKTGKSKNEKKICPGGEYEDYYNQIGLYKYYFEKSTGKQVRETIFVFPEDYTNNFTINFTAEECSDIVENFKKSISDIKSYKFDPINNRDKNKEPCKYCQYKDFCKLDLI